MIAAIDVHYQQDTAKAVGIFFNSWNEEGGFTEIVKRLTDIEAYEPGRFYKRELPCILKVLEDINLSQIEAVIIDGYVYIDNQYQPGLGALLWEKLNKRIPIIGVAKNSFHGNQQTVVEVYRGQSIKPLYVSSIGLDVIKAAGFIKNMTGSYRIPDLLKLLDHKTKHDE